MQKHKASRNAAVATAVLTTMLLGAGVAQAAPSTEQVKALDATVITEVTPLGLKVTGLAVEYNATLGFGSDIDESSFVVASTLNRPGVSPVSGSRSVANAYTSADVNIGGGAEPGKYIILELDENDPLARASYNTGGFTTFYDLVGSYKVSQVKTIAAGEQRANAHPGRDITNSGVRNLVVDEYSAGTLSAASGVTLPYRFFEPKTAPGQKYPLVVTLHGHGESGSNNFSQIAGNQISVAFADPERQATDPAFVLSPQAAQAPAPSGGWFKKDAQDAVVELVKATIAANPAIDPDRVYLTGLSMGSFGSWRILPAHSELFAGALLVCGAGDEAAAVSALGDFPIWAVHSADDAVVAYDAPGSDYRIFRALESAGHAVTWSEWAGTTPDEQQEAAAADARDRAATTGSQHIFTTFPAGTTPLFSHGSWIPTYTNDVMLDWLFEQ